MTLGDYRIKGRSPVIRPRQFTSSGAVLDLLNVSSPTIANNGWWSGTGLVTELDTGDFVTTASGSGWFAAGTPLIEIPAGADGLYQVSVFASLGGTASSFPWHVLAKADDQYGSSVWSQLTLQTANNIGYMGMSSGIDQQAFGGGSAAFPLVGGDLVGIVVGQHSGGSRSLYYACLSVVRIT